MTVFDSINPFSVAWAVNCLKIGIAFATRKREPDADTGKRRLLAPHLPPPREIHVNSSWWFSVCRRFQKTCSSNIIVTVIRARIIRTKTGLRFFSFFDDRVSRQCLGQNFNNYIVSTYYAPLTSIFFFFFWL